MGFFGSLVGWDQSNGAVNAVLASYLIEKTDSSTRKRIAQEVVNIIGSVQRRSPNLILQDISKQSRVVQMNFIALACDNLYIEPPVRNNVWSRVENPYRVGNDIDENRISAAVHAIQNQDGVCITWPGNAAKLDFERMYEDGSIHPGGESTIKTNALEQKAANNLSATHSISKDTADFSDVPWARDKFEANKYRFLRNSGYTLARDAGKVMVTSPEGKCQSIYTSFQLDDLVEAVNKSQGKSSSNSC